MTTGYDTREDWLNAFIDRARPVFANIGAPLPMNVRVSVGFTSKGNKGGRIGECWGPVASEDGHYEIFLKPTLDNVARICDVLSHELVHTAAGLDAMHGKAFGKIARGIGLTGRMEATEAGPDWMRWALPIISDLGPMPYGALDGAKMVTTGRKPQETNMVKMECPACGFLARATRKHIDAHSYLNCPAPDCIGELVIG